MKIISFILLFLIIISLSGFSAAYQTFHLIKENLEDTKVVAIADIDSSEVKEPYTIIKLYPDLIEKNKYSELLNYTTIINSNIQSIIVYSDDKSAINIIDNLKKISDVSVVVHIGNNDQNNVSYNSNDKSTFTGGLGSITTGSLVNLDKENSSAPKLLTPTIIGIFIMIVLIMILVFLMRKK